MNKTIEDFYNFNKNRNRIICDNKKCELFSLTNKKENKDDFKLHKTIDDVLREYNINLENFYK